MEPSQGQNVLKSLSKYFSLMEPGTHIYAQNIECCATCRHFHIEFENPPKEMVDTVSTPPIIYNNCVNPKFKKAFFTLGYFKCDCYEDMRKKQIKHVDKPEKEKIRKVIKIDKSDTPTE